MDDVGACEHCLAMEDGIHWTHCVVHGASAESGEAGKSRLAVGSSRAERESGTGWRHMQVQNKAAGGTNDREMERIV